MICSDNHKKKTSIVLLNIQKCDKKGMKYFTPPIKYFYVYYPIPSSQGFYFLLI